MTVTSPVFSTNTAGLVPFVEAGLLAASDVYVADTIATATGETNRAVVLGAALAVRAVREGHVCISLSQIAGSVYSDLEVGSITQVLAWPDPGEWHRQLSESPAVRMGGEPLGESVPPLVLDGERLYLDRYWRYECDLAEELVRRASHQAGLFTAGAQLNGVLDVLFGPTSDHDRQRRVAELALTRHVTIIAGGPGTGKTRTLARIFAAAFTLAKERGVEFRPALAAPTATAAKRMTQALNRELEESYARSGLDASDLAALGRATEATTLHRLLGARRSSVFSHNRDNRLPHNFVIVDEVSMVSLPLMAHLLEALAPDANLLLVGDPYQLASVEAGAVLEEIVGPGDDVRHGEGPLGGAIVHLNRQHRFDQQSSIAQLSIAVREGNAEHALELLSQDPSQQLAWVHDDDSVGIADLSQVLGEHALKVVEHAHIEDIAGCLGLLRTVKVLSATRNGEFGMYRWSDRVESHLARNQPEGTLRRPWYEGRPVIVNRNDNLNRIYNGDVGIVVNSGRPVVALLDEVAIRYVLPTQLDDVDTWWAMTIHKSQGSEFDHVIVSLPLAPSPILTRELLYTAITRARHKVTLVASKQAITSAIERPAGRSSGLGEKLWPR